MPRHWPRLPLAAAFLGLVFGNWSDTSTGLDLKRFGRFPLTKVRSGFMKSGTHETFDGITSTAVKDGRDVFLRGVGKSGKRWEANLSAVDQVWRGDLDSNGTQDYVFFAVGPFGNGRTAPPFSLSILLMDADGMPTPFFTTQYHEEDGSGIAHLVDLNHDRHAQLLISAYDERSWDSNVGGGCSGHWTTQLYQFKDFAVEEIRDTVAGTQFPFIHEWSYGAEKCPGPGRPAAQPILYEHGTGAAPVVTTIVRPADQSGLPFKIAPAAGCDTVLPRVVVYDRPRMRQISFPNPFSAYQPDLVTRVQQDGTPVQLRGIDHWMGHRDCSVNLTWATTNQNK